MLVLLPVPRVVSICLALIDANAVEQVTDLIRRAVRGRLANLEADPVGWHDAIGTDLLAGLGQAADTDAGLAAGKANVAATVGGRRPTLLLLFLAFFFFASLLAAKPRAASVPAPIAFKLRRESRTSSPRVQRSNRCASMAISLPRIFPARPGCGIRGRSGSRCTRSRRSTGRQCHT